MLVHENSLVRIDEDIPLDVACLVGCGVLTGVGAALRTAAVQAGQTVAVFGCGGVGLSIVQGAAIAGAGQVIAVDRVASKLDLARSLGATDVVDVVRRRRRGCRPRADRRHRASTTPSRPSACPASSARPPSPWPCGGPARSSASRPTARSSRSRTPRSAPSARSRRAGWARTGSASTSPATSTSTAKGRLRLDEIVSRRAPLDDVNDAFAAMHEGEGARTVLVFD